MTLSFTRRFQPLIGWQRVVIRMQLFLVQSLATHLSTGALACTPRLNTGSFGGLMDVRLSLQDSKG